MPCKCHASFLKSSLDSVLTLPGSFNENHLPGSCNFHLVLVTAALLISPCRSCHKAEPKSALQRHRHAEHKATVIKIHKRNVITFLFGLIILYAQNSHRCSHNMHCLRTLSIRLVIYYVSFCPLMLYNVQEHGELK